MSDLLAEPNTLDQLGTLVDQRFRLLELLGTGPLHQVYRAKDESEGGEVCLKIPRPRFRSNDGFATRYRRDLLNIMNLSDSNWVVPNLLVEHEGVPLQVLPLMAGHPLPQWFELTGRKEGRLLVVITRAVKALQRLQRVGRRIHGTIKPSNLYVDDGDEPLFLDLAATGRLEDHFTEKARSGQPIYCSPEQLSGERADAGSDLYSLGLVLYQAFTGKHPFFGTGPENLDPSPEHLLISLLSQLQSRPVPPSSLRDDVPAWADRFLARCLHPNPRERFSSYQEALDWLQNHTKQDLDVSIEQRTLPPAGRELEMQFLHDQLEDIVKGEGGSIVRLRGDSGSGKTRCLEWLVERAEGLGLKVVSVEPTPESGLHLQSVLAELSRDFPEVVQESRPVVESLLSIAMEEALFLVIRDVQQADDTLVEFLKELNTVLSDVPLLLLLVEEEDSTFRSSEMLSFVRELEQSFRIGPLDRRAIAHLIEEKCWTPPSGSVASWVHKVSLGNGLHATLLVDFLMQNDYVSEAVELAWKSSPPTERPTLQEAIIWKLAGLSVLARTILEAAAVLGHTFRLGTLNAINYRSEEEADQALGEAVSKGILELIWEHKATSYRWKHPKFRLAMLADIHPRRKQRIHRLAAAFYSRGQSEPAKMAYHFLQAGDTPELFYWGSRAVERAWEQKRRGECNFWMNVLLTRVPEHEWLGPDIHRTRSLVSRDQITAVDLTDWSQWLRTLSGRAVEPDDAKTPLLQAQRALSSSLSWQDWKVRVLAIAQELKNSTESPEDQKRALGLLGREWQIRSGGGEPFPTFHD